MQIPVLGLIGVVEDEENLSMWAELADRPLDPKVSIDGVKKRDDDDVWRKEPHG